MKSGTYTEIDSTRREAISLLLANDPKLLRMLFSSEKDELRSPPEIILKLSKGMSSGEKLLVHLALEIWDGSGNPRLSDVLYLLDDCRFEGFLLALERIRFHNLL